MTTVSTAVLNKAASEWADGMDYPSATKAGIVPDLTHLKRGGAHCSLQDLKKYGNFPDFSSDRGRDLFPPATNVVAAAAIDTSMSTSDMVKCWYRVQAVFDDHTDPRRRFFAAFNGWNGKGEAERLDFRANKRYVASPDHKWHCHDEWWRSDVDSLVALDAKMSVFRGESKASYIKRHAPAPKPVAGEPREGAESMNLFVRVDGEAPVYEVLSDREGRFRAWIRTEQELRTRGVDPRANVLLEPKGTTEAQLTERYGPAVTHPSA